MDQHVTLHILDSVANTRAEQVSIGSAFGFHCEPYQSDAELLAFRPEKGIIVARDDASAGGVANVLRVLFEFEIFLPVIATAEDPHPSNVVTAIKAGALNYLRLSELKRELVQAVEGIATEAEAFSKARRRAVEAQRRVSCLSPREQEVLCLLALGQTTKMIARQLNLSPRTVDIYRANLVCKIGAKHTAEAVRIHSDAVVFERDMRKVA